MRTRRANQRSECPRSESGVHLWVTKDGLEQVKPPAQPGLFLHYCAACGCVRQTIVRPDGSRGRSYKA